jgi:5S rRNA maturation endonuclease (ribonuclease M5)
MARCPAHDDGKASLSVGPGQDQPVVIHCHAGCERDDILAKLGLTWADLCSEQVEKLREEWTPYGPAVSIYDYIDEQGTLLFQVLRTVDKQFPARRPDAAAKSGWAWKLGDTRRVLYRLPQVIEAAKAGQVIYVTEGEKDVHALERYDLVGTCNPGGAGKWRDEFSEHLREAHVVIIADKDEPGQRHARQVAASLEGIASHVRIVESAAGKDATDHFLSGRTAADLVETWTSEEEAKADLAPDIWDFLATDDPPYDWVVPFLLERGDRLVWTGFEGLGKSMFTRQLAVMVAAGLDPFSETKIPPKRVLLIDCENSERQSRRKFRPLANATIDMGRHVEEGMLRLIHRPAGIDLSRDDHAAWLMERVTAHQPDLLIIGPFYRLHAGDMNDERMARKVVGVLDAVRIKVDCALVTEAHAGHGEAGRNRSLRPAGSSLLLRWPEFGYGIAPHPDENPAPGQPATRVAVKQWRGARDERNWPSWLRWGNPWPWVVDPYGEPGSNL